MFYERRLHATHELPPHCCPVCCCCPCHASFAPPTAATPICRLCCSWSIPFQHAPQHSAPAAVACLPATAAGCMRFFAYFNASLSMQLTGTCHSGCHWRWRWRWRRLCNNYLNAAIIFMQTRSGQFARSLSHALSPFLPLSLSRSFRIISQFSQFYCYYHEESDYYYYYYYYAGFKNTHFGMCMHMHGI